jgi:hypothetical protein
LAFIDDVIFEPMLDVVIDWESEVDSSLQSSETSSDTILTSLGTPTFFVCPEFGFKRKL